MPGLDPGIHQSAKNLFAMDGRVKPGHDELRMLLAQKENARGERAFS